LRTLYNGFSPLVLLQKKEKESSYQLEFRFTLTAWYAKRGKKVFYRSFAAGVRKAERVETKMKRKKKVK
jgi:hypothetical protein